MKKSLGFLGRQNTLVYIVVAGSWSCQQSQLKGSNRSPAPEPVKQESSQDSQSSQDSINNEVQPQGLSKNQTQASDKKVSNTKTAAKKPTPPIELPPEPITAPTPPTPTPTPSPTPYTPTPPATTSAAPTPPVTPPSPVTPPPEACTPDRPPTLAFVHVTVTLFSNMEHGFHVIEEGAIFQLVQNGKVVIAGLATMEAVTNGTPTDGNGAYPGRVLRLEATYAPQPTSGSGTIFLCQGPLGVLPQSADCQNLPETHARDPERPVEIRGQPVSWTVSGGQSFGLMAGGSVPNINVQGGNFNVSGYHPVFAAAAPGAAFKDFQSPLVLDLNKNGRFDLIDVWDDSTPVRFDLKGDGRRGRTGWVSPEDGLLGLDVNKNGTIDSGEELFGEYSVGAGPKAGQKTFDNGFLALSQFDTNQDRLIDARDPIYSQLVLWQDLNSDGISQPNELKRLPEHYIKSFSLKYMTMKPGSDRFVKNNEVRLLGTFQTTDGHIWGLADVWFKQRRYTDGQLVQK